MHFPTKTFAQLPSYCKGFCYLCIGFLGLLFCQNGLAAESAFISINNLDHAKTRLSQLQKLSDLPVIVPSQIPAPQHGQTFYISYSSYANHPNYKQYWQINVDVTPDCHGMRICNIGLISAESPSTISPYYETLPNQKKQLKERVALPGHINAYFTPFHIAAGAVNPTLEWRQKNIKYTLTWRIDAPSAEQKQILLHIAQSALR